MIWHACWEAIFSTYRTHDDAECIASINGICFARRASWKAGSSEQKSSVRPEDGQELHLATSSREAEAIETRDLSLRDGRWDLRDRRTNDDDRFCRRSLLLFLIFPWWPPTLYRLLSLVILVLHVSSVSLYFLLSLLSSLSLSLDFLHHHVWTSLGRCSRNCSQGGDVEKKDNFVPRFLG